MKPVSFILGLIGLISVSVVDCDKFLIMHPFYSGSHVLTLHHVAESLVKKGHQVSLCFRRKVQKVTRSNLAGSHVKIPRLSPIQIEAIGSEP